MSDSMEYHPAYLAGLVDGDGSVGVRRVRDGYGPQVAIGQFRPDSLLEWLHKKFGGTVSKTSNPPAWAVRGRDGIIPFLSLIAPYLLLKDQECKCAQGIAATMGARGIYISDATREHRHRLYGVYTEAINGRRNHSSKPVIYEQFHPAYVAGILDSDGMIRIGKRKSTKSVGGTFYDLRISIKQHRQDNMYTWLKEQYGGCDDGAYEVPGWTVAAGRAGSFLDWIYPYVVVKRDEVDLALRFIGTLKQGCRTALTKETLEERELLYKECKACKLQRVPKSNGE